MTPATIWDSIARHASCRRNAVVVGGRATSYETLADEVVAIAAAVRDGGLSTGPSPRVGLLLRPSAAFVSAFLAAGASGVAAVVLQHDWSSAELRRALTLARPALVLTDSDAASRIGRPVRNRLVVPVDDEVAGAVRAAAAATVGGPVDRRVITDATPFYVGFTSGSTGGPRGFVRSHASWLASFDASEAFGIAAGDHVFAPGPLEHSLFLYATVHALAVGATAHLLGRFSAAAALDALARQPVSHVYVVPTMLTALLREAQRRGDRRFPDVRTIICSGARWPPVTRQRLSDVFPNADAIDFYGASETSFVSMRRPRPDDAPTGVGWPFPGVEIAVRRSDGTQGGVGETGRLWVRSAMLFDGYLDPDAEGAQCDADGWLTIGDLAHVDAHGQLHLMGRETAMLVRGGVNVFPEEVEDVLMTLPEVAEAIVVGLPDPYWGDLLCAVVRWRDDRTLPRSELRDHCRRHLARHKRPQRWLEVRDLPRTASGKVARHALTAGLRDGTLPIQDVT